MSKTLTLTIFGKTRKTKEGREFKTYFTTLPNNEKVKVKFREDCGTPQQTPCNIDLVQGSCNLSIERYKRKVKDNTIDETNGEAIPTVLEEDVESKVLWISTWAYSPEEYRDTSMDEFF